MFSKDNFQDVRSRSVFIHVSLPGQDPHADDLDGAFPSMTELGLHLVTVLDHLRVKQVLVLLHPLGSSCLIGRLLDLETGQVQILS